MKLDIGITSAKNKSQTMYFKIQITHVLKLKTQVWYFSEAENVVVTYRPLVKQNSEPDCFASSENY